MITENAPAKINLYLHIGGLRADGLHGLKSLFVFTEEGDRVAARESDSLSLNIEGPFAPALTDFPIESNLVWRAAEELRRHLGEERGASITLEKNLPIAAGIGGGSADAAAALRALVRLWRVDISPGDLSALAFKIGADVPACLSRVPVNVAGAGEETTAGPSLPPLWACLINPRVETLTGPIFRRFDKENPAPKPPEFYADPVQSYEDVKQMMAATRNDLEPAALALTPIIADVLAFLRSQTGVVAARMSGSGATCFGLFASCADAEAAQLEATGRGWWAMSSKLAIGLGKG